MVANFDVPASEDRLSNREYVAHLARVSGWDITSDGYLDTYTWPHMVDLEDGGPPIRVKPNTVLWDETQNLALQADGQDVDEHFSHPHSLAFAFSDTFGDPGGVKRFGPELVRGWVRDAE